MKKMTAGYCRVSTKDQVEYGTSLEDQKVSIKAECKRQGWQLFKIYSDDGVSGTIEDRPAVVEILKDAKAKKFNTVAFTKIDRASRELRLLLNFGHELDKLGVKLYSIDDTSINDPVNGQLSLHILGAIAHHEAARIKERTTRGRKIKWNNGQAFIGTVPFGYEWNKEKNRIEVAPKEKKIYEKIVSLYLDAGHSMIDIVNILNSEGIPPPSNKRKKKKSKRWYAQSIRDMLINTAYKGHAYYNRNVFEYDEKIGRSRKTNKLKPRDQWVKVEYPVLISGDRWNAIQLRRERQKVKPKKHFYEYKDCFLATGLLSCGECGGKLRRQAYRQNGKDYLYYVCSNKGICKKTLEYLERDRCTGKHWDAQKIDDRIFWEIAKILSSPGHYAKAWLKDQDTEELSAKIKRLKEKKQALESAIKRNIKASTHADDSDLAKLYKAQLRQDEKEFRAAKTKLKQAEYELSFKADRVNRLEAFEKAINGSNSRKKGSIQVAVREAFSELLFSLPFEDKKRVLEAVVQPETGGKITIRNLWTSDLVDMAVKNDKPVDGEGPVIELDFAIDIIRFERLISSLNFSNLSYQNDIYVADTYDRIIVWIDRLIQRTLGFQNKKPGENSWRQTMWLISTN